MKLRSFFFFTLKGFAVMLDYELYIFERKLATVLHLQGGKAQKDRQRKEHTEGYSSKNRSGG
jgi:hypothetical protein